jgi:hypothetical protein
MDTRDMALEIPRVRFPEYGQVPAKRKLDELKRLLSENIFATQYMDAKAAASLLAQGLKTYRDCTSSSRWSNSLILSKFNSSSGRFNLVCAALFDLVCNAEYIHGRVTNRNWIYCNRHREEQAPQVYAYFSYLKQCPKCCQDRPLDPRLAGAQHKPSSHHIGEITTTTIGFFLSLLAASAIKPLRVGVISKQSHDVDAMAWRDDFLVLFEIKASPLITYPLRVKMIAPFKEDALEGPIEVLQHKLIDVEYLMHDISLYLANLDKDIPLGQANHPRWPYPELTAYIDHEDGLLDYLEAWGEVFLAYSVPKTERRGRQIVLGYLANGWGDEIDSNKTKAGLGRTDDIKKGTYQLLKFGAYYRDGSPNLPVRGALVTNLDPLFLYADYMEKLIDARWAPARKFQQVQERPDYQEILDRDLFYLYDAVIAFNRPVTNDSQLVGCFDFAAAENALMAGKFDTLLQSWVACA